MNRMPTPGLIHDPVPRKNEMNVIVMVIVMVSSSKSSEAGAFGQERSSTRQPITAKAARNCSRRSSRAGSYQGTP